MFSRIFTFGLAALSFVGAAPATGFQSPMAISCSIDIQPAGSSATYSLEPGIYHIRDFAKKSQLISYSEEAPIHITPGPGLPGDFGKWAFEEASDGAFTIWNVGLGYPVYVDDEDGTLISGEFQDSIPFAIELAGEKTFKIKSVNDDLVWTLANPEESDSEVQLRPANGTDSQRWRFVRLGPL